MHTPECRARYPPYGVFVGQGPEDDEENFQGMPWDEFLEILDKRAAEKFPPKKRPHLRVMPTPPEDEQAQD